MFFFLRGSVHLIRTPLPSYGNLSCVLLSYGYLCYFFTKIAFFMWLYYPQPNRRVVVAKFPMGAVAVGELLELGKPFGTIVKHLVFPAKVFTHQKDIIHLFSLVNHLVIS